MYRIHIHKLGSVHASLSRFLLLICLLLLSSEFLLGLSGRILDEQGSAIAGATITDKRAHCFSDEEGFFNLTTTADSLYISRIGYHNTALPTQSFRSPVILKAEAIVLPTVWVRAVEYKPSSPSLSVLVIHPDTNSEVSNTADLLLTNSSFSTTDTRLSGERQTVSLLGSFNRHSLVMMDGVVLNSAGEAFDFSKIPLGQISHIEIIKGNASVYGGSAAIGGIIHIHTKQAVDKASWEAGITSSLGSFGYLKQAYHASYRKKHFSLTTEYTHQCADNDFEYNTPDFWNMEPELKRLHNHKVADGFFAKTSYYTGGTQLDYSLNLGSFVRQLPGPINFLELYDDSKLTGAYAQHNLRGIITHRRLANELLLWYNTDASTYCNLEPTLFFGTNHYRQYQQSRGIKAASNLSYEDLKFNLSAEHSQVFYRFENRIQGSSISGTRESTALALGAQHNYFPFIFQCKTALAFRGDYCDEDLHPTWRLEQEITLPLKWDFTLGGYLGTAFSQPSLFDMYWIGDSETYGNPDLKNESSIGYSIYASATYAGYKLRAAYYLNKVDELIQWRQYYLNGASWKPFNVGRAEISNYELESQLELIKYLALGAAITFTRACDFSRATDGSPLPTYNKHLVYTPDLKGMIFISLADERRGVSLRYSYTGKQYSTPDNLIDPLPAFDNLDGAAFYKLAFPHYELACDLKLNNLLNKRYDIYAYIPQPGFNWTAGLSASVRY